MKEIRFEYTRFRFWKKKRMSPVPEGWKELSAAQFIASTRLYLGSIAEDEFLKTFFGFSAWFVKQLSIYQKYKLFEQVEFVHDARTSHWEFYLQRIPSTRLLAPRERLDGMCFQQFMMVDTYFSRFLITKKEEFLDRMVASLYLKENERFALSFESVPSLFKRNPVLLNMEKRLPVIRALSKEIKFALFLNFILIKRWLGAAYPHLFPQAEEEEKESQRKKNKKEQKKQVTTNWLEIFDSFVGDNIPQAEKYQIMPVMDAFRILNRKIRDAKKHNH